MKLKSYQTQKISSKKISSKNIPRECSFFVAIGRVHKRYMLYDKYINLIESSDKHGSIRTKSESINTSV